MYSKKEFSIIFLTLNYIIMSKGPVTASVINIDTAGGFHSIKVKNVISGKEDLVILPSSADIQTLKKDDIVTYYRADEQEIISMEQTDEERVVLLFSRKREGDASQTSKVFWIAKGEKLPALEKVLEQNELPRIIVILLSLSAYYGKREDFAKEALNILRMSQDPEAIDALFSVSSETLSDLLGENFSTVSVQIADSLINLALADGDLEHPRKRELRQILMLATLHGETRKKIYDFISEYERE